MTTSRWFRDMSEDEKQALACNCIDWAMSGHVDWSDPASDMEQALYWWMDSQGCRFEDEDDAIEWLESIPGK